ncbi:unnamed protein product [Arctogadus glacialis]
MVRRWIILGHLHSQQRVVLNEAEKKLQNDNRDTREPSAVTGDCGRSVEVIKETSKQAPEGPVGGTLTS